MTAFKRLRPRTAIPIVLSLVPAAGSWLVRRTDLWTDKLCRYTRMATATAIVTMPREFVILLLLVAAFALLSLTSGASYLDVVLPGGLPVGNALAAVAKIEAD